MGLIQINIIIIYTCTVLGIGVPSRVFIRRNLPQCKYVIVWPWCRVYCSCLPLLVSVCWTTVSGVRPIVSARSVVHMRYSDLSPYWLTSYCCPRSLAVNTSPHIHIVDAGACTYLYCDFSMWLCYIRNSALRCLNLVTLGLASGKRPLVHCA